MFVHNFNKTFQQLWSRSDNKQNHRLPLAAILVNDIESISFGHRFKREHPMQVSRDNNPSLQPSIVLEKMG